MDYSISDAERLNLRRMVDEADCGNNTDNIRKLKHSVRIRDDIRRLENLKTRHATLRTNDVERFEQLCQEECSFLYTNYTDIFKKVFKDELDLEIMTKLLMVLKMVEDGKVDQHEGSVIMGKILKELYIDSAIKHADNLDKEHVAEVEPQNEGVNISWKEFKASKTI
jgi:hypothetical protein